MKTNIKFILSGAFALLFALLIVLVLLVDVGAICPENKSMGLSGINKAFRDLTGVNMIWYKVTGAMGILAIALGLLFMAYGGITLLIRKSFAKVDKFIYALGCVYVLLGIIYIFFEKVIINYRPIIMPDATAPEASFPSSHTLLIVTIVITAAITLFRLLDGKKALRAAVVSISSLYTAVAVFGRLICGVHWLTDIASGVLISISLLSLYSSLIRK